MNANASDHPSGAFLFMRHGLHGFSRMAEKHVLLFSGVYCQSVSIRAIRVSSPPKPALAVELFIAQLVAKDLRVVPEGRAHKLARWGSDITMANAFHKTQAEA